MSTVEFFYDIASPYSYLAAARIERVAGDVAIRWRPFLLGGVFAGSGNKMPGANPAKARYMLHDLKRSAAAAGTPFSFSPFFPSNSLLVMRVLNAVEGAERVALTHRFFQACWVDGRNIADPETVAALLGDDAPATLERALAQANKDALRAVTDEAVARGAFGAPTLFVGDELFFGNDRVEQAIERARG